MVNETCPHARSCPGTNDTPGRKSPTSLPCLFSGSGSAFHSVPKASQVLEKYWAEAKGSVELPTLRLPDPWIFQGHEETSIDSLT